MRAGPLVDAGLTFAGNVVFPRLSHRLRWQTRLGPGGTLACVLARTAFAVCFVWFLSEVAQRQKQVWAEVREHLGREPTPDEVLEYVRAHMAS